ncbi:MerR family transcriptional regulator [SAR86 cluster bacterium]|nr:MerR family transcriptional regulator [SAR86 cluster bacterium]
MSKILNKEKKYYSIAEVAELCKVKAHTLRFWEKEFKDLQPITRKGSRRYYQNDDIELIKQIHSLLYLEGMTIAGAKRNLKSFSQEQRKDVRIQNMLEDLKRLLAEIK